MIREDNVIKRGFFPDNLVAFIDTDPLDEEEHFIPRIPNRPINFLGTWMVLVEEAESEEQAIELAATLLQQAKGEKIPYVYTRIDPEMIKGLYDDENYVNYKDII